MKKVNLLLTLLVLVSLAGCLPSRHVQGQSAAQNAPKAAPAAQKNLAIFIFDGVQIIDYTGPFEVLGHAYDNNQRLFNIYTVAEKPDAITTNMGMTVVPKYTFDNMPPADVLMLPGGGVDRHLDNEKVIKWVQDTSAHAEYVMSVCNGAFYLGKAGLLDGLTATTFYGLIDELKVLAPKARIVSDQRFTDNGKIITTAGLSSGIDGALHLIERILGHAKAQEVALGLEYNWQPEQNYARASLADMHLLRLLGREGFKLPEGTGWKVLGQWGGKENWEKNWEVQTSISASELLKIIDTKLAERWSKVETKSAKSSTSSRWKFTDEQSKAWGALSSIQPVEGKKDTYKLTIKLARNDASAKLLEQ